MPKELVATAEPDKKTRIVILGGGFGGVRAALNLSENLPSAEITLVDKNAYHSYYPDLYEFSSAIFPGNNVTEPAEFRLLKSTVAVPFEKIFEGYANIKFRNSAALGADFKRNEAKLEDGILRYDFLILALGSETNFFGIPGLQEEALELKNTADALNIRSGIEEIFKSRGKRDIISVVIGGGGFTGCELAGELAVGLKKLSKIYQHPEKNISISLLEGAKTLLGPTDPWFQREAKRRLENLGVKVMLESFIFGVKDGSVTLKSNASVPYDVLIWTAGVKPNGFVKTLDGVSLEKNSCIVTDNNLRAVPYENVFVIGDMAFCKNPKTGKPLPMTAQVALEQANYVSRFISKKLGKKSCADFKPSLGRFIIPLGGKFALADLGFIKLSGFLPWLIKRFVALKYFFSILSKPAAFEMWWRGVKIFTRDD